MPPQLERAFEIETTWIREFAQTYLPSETGFSFTPEDLRDAGVSLIGVRNILRKCHVTYVNKLDMPGAVWVVEGDNNDGEKFCLTLRVISESLAVSLEKIVRV